MPLLVPEDAWAIMTILGEAAGESYEGKLAVAAVIRNRIRFQYNTRGGPRDTVLARKQFSMWDDKARLLAARADTDDPAVAESQMAWYESEFVRPVGDAVLYFNPKVADPAWADRVRFVKRIGNHDFYEDPVLDKRAKVVDEVAREIAPFLDSLPKKKEE